MLLPGLKDIQDLLNGFQDIACHYPFVEGNSVFLDYTAHPLSSKCYFSVNKQISFIGELLQRKYLAAQCQKPVGAIPPSEGEKKIVIN
ncbi:MAG: hypothetical protein Q8940_07345 [Bacteroidota bacterium]|nr:hypothetical protein [Bacteroidota bacterium]